MAYYNGQRPHSSVDDQPPASRFSTGRETIRIPGPRQPERTGDQWISRRVAVNGVVCVAYQQVSVGKHYAGSACDVLVGDGLLQFWIGNELIKTTVRASTGEIRKKRAAGTTASAR